MSVDNCIFCKILADEIPSSVVYEDDMFRAILDVNPAAKGHVIILPKKHAANIFELPDEDFDCSPQNCESFERDLSLRWSKYFAE